MTLFLFFLMTFICPPSSLEAAPSVSPTTSSNSLNVPANIEIDRIEFEGVTLFNQVQLENVLEISAGDRLNRPLVIKTDKNIQELYRNQGYEQVSVRSELLKQPTGTRSENVLLFRVQEGLPSRFSDVSIHFKKSNAIVVEGIEQSGKPVELDKKEAKLAELIEKHVGILPGDLAQKEKLNAARRAIQDFLVSEEYVGAKADDVRLVPNLAMTPDLKTARWLNVEFHIELGDRVTFGFRGNTIFTQGQLNGWIEDQRAVGLSRDYITAIAKHIIDEYKTQGYGDAKVVPYTFENQKRSERHVTFEISEGPRYRMSDVRFDGNMIFTQEVLLQKFFNSASPLVKRKIFVEKDIEKASELTIEWLKSQGYLFAKVVTLQYIPVEKPSVKDFYKDIVIYIYEGSQTTVRSIDFSGLHAFARLEAISILNVQVDAPLNLFALNEGLETFKFLYRSKGYLGIRILNEGQNTLVRYASDNQEAAISLEIDEGPQFKTGRIDIEGLERTREEVVRREVSFQVGEVLTEPLIVETESKLRRLGIFSQSSIKLQDDLEKPGYKVVKIQVQEGTPGIIAGGVGIRTDLGLRVFGQTAYTNLWNRNHTLSLNVTVNQRFDEDFCDNLKPFGQHSLTTGNCFIEYQAQLGYDWPWFTWGATTFRPRITFDRTQYINFDATSIALGLTWERRLFKKIPLTGIFTYNLERTRYFNAIDDIDNQTLTIGSVIPSLRFDLRDNPLAPTRGFFAITSFEYASPYFLSQSEPVPVSYTRFQYRMDYTLPIAREVSGYFSFRTGIARNLASPPPDAPFQEAARYAIPLSKQFTLGGVGSLRGFHEQELNVREKAIRGTLSYVNYRTQIDLPFAGALRFGPFLDGGNLIENGYSLGALRYGAGVGFHYLSPVGPVNFDWGFKLDPRPNEDTSQFYFSIGVI